jgi:hypothetical protein
MIVKLKSIYLLLGGDMHKLQRESYLEKISYQESADSMGLRKKGRPSKSARKSNIATPLKMG